MLEAPHLSSFPLFFSEPENTLCYLLAGAGKNTRTKYCPNYLETAIFLNVSKCSKYPKEYHDIFCLSPAWAIRHGNEVIWPNLEGGGGGCGKFDLAFIPESWTCVVELSSSTRWKDLNV